MPKRTFRVYALSLAGGALLLGGASVAAGAMTLPLPALAGGIAEQSTAAIVTDGADTPKVEQVWWRGPGWGWHRPWGAGAGAAAGGATGTLMLAAVGKPRGVHQKPATPARRCRSHLAQGRPVRRVTIARRGAIAGLRALPLNPGWRLGAAPWTNRGTRPGAAGQDGAQRNNDA
jgi:hypothetical protein